MLCRGLVGTGEASFVTVAPTIIADMYVGNQRSVALMIFYFAIPIGRFVFLGIFFINRNITEIPIFINTSTYDLSDSSHHPHWNLL